MAARRITLVLAVILLAGCSGRSDSGNDPRTSDAQARLPSGLVVPQGSHRVGPVFTVPDSRFTDTVAVIVVDQEPLAVYDSIASQARGRGVRMGGSGAVGPVGLVPCQLELKNRPVRLGTVDASKARALHCMAYGQLPDGGSDLVFSLLWGGVSHNGVVEVRQPSWGPNPAPPVGTGRARGVRGLPRVKEQSRATEPGTRFGGVNNAFNHGYQRFRLERGSRVVVDAPGLTGDDVFAVLRIHGAAEAVMRRYARQLGAGPGPTPEVRTVATPNGTVLLVENSPFGGGAARLVTDPSRRWMLIRASSD